MIDPAWSAKIEYRYTDYPKDFHGTSALAYADLTTQTVLFGVNYRGPIVERFLGRR